MELNLSDEEIYNNIHDRKWRVENLYSIRNKKSKTVPFRLNNTQKRLHESKSRYNMTLKGRQQGVSTYYILKYFDKACWEDNINAVILSHDDKSIKKLFRIASFAYKNMPNELKPTLSKGGGSQYEMFFPERNSRISVMLEVRSDAVSDLHVSEYGLMKNKDRFNASIEAVPYDVGEISIESTPFGMNHFNDDWVDPDFPYTKHFFPWYFHHENIIEDHGKISYTAEEKLLVEKAKSYGIVLKKDQVAWRRFKIKQKGSSAFFQEHPEDDITCFLMSGNPVLDLQEVAKWLKAANDPIEDDGTVKIWEHFIEGEKYVLGADTAEGIGGDFSVAPIYKKSSMTQVAQIRGKIKPKPFAELIFNLCERYVSFHGEYPLVAVERNNHGHAVLLWLDEKLDYPNLFTHTDDRIGWMTNKLTRPVMLDVFLDGVENMLINIKDKATLGELMTLINNSGKIEAMTGKHDDCVIAHAIAIQMCMEKANYLDALLME